MTRKQVSKIQYCKVIGCGAEVGGSIQARIDHMREAHGVHLKPNNKSAVRWYFTPNLYAIEFLA